jgi:ubiquinone/menaquinone biosynthesis C-methylase UbiE
MNWHETIAYARNEPSLQSQIQESYLSEDLTSNIEAFRNSDEFKATLSLLSSLNIPQNAKLLDVGAGNGISSIAFAMQGFKVTALEPDNSDTVGAAAIIKLKEVYDLPDLIVVSSFGEDMPFDDNFFDVVYARQCVHHAYHLQQFTKSIYRVVKPGGILLTVRDHVISDEADKQAFLKRHPLHKFYGGENAFTLDEYRNAIITAGFNIKQVLAPADSVINYSPWSTHRIKTILKKKLGGWAANKIVINLSWRFIKYRLNRLPGRLYSFVSIK